MGEAISPYISFSEEFSKSLGNIEKRLGKKKEQIRSYEIKELVNIGSTLNAAITSRKAGGPFISHATFYDSVTTIKELTESALLEFNINELKEIEKETNQAVELAAKKMTVKKASNRLLNYISSLSDLSIISESIKEICFEINKYKGTEEKFDAKKQFFEVEKAKTFIEDLKTKISGIIDRMKYVIGSASDALKKAFKRMENFFKQSVLPKFLAALKFIGEKLNEFKLKLIENMFGFIGEVAKLAREKNWEIREINMEMPEIGLEFAEINALGISANIPIPKITQPKVSVKFTPTSV